VGSRSCARAHGIPARHRFARRPLKRGIYIVRGSGAGQDDLRNQFCFNHAAAGTVRSSHPSGGNADRMMQLHMRHVVLDRAVFPTVFIDVWERLPRLAEGGIKEFTNLLRRENRTHNATLLIMDGSRREEEIERGGSAS